MSRLRRTATIALVVVGVVILAGCASDALNPPGHDTTSAAPVPSAEASATGIDLSAIDCATEDPTGLGELTGVWRGSEGGFYYIRHVGDCLWWFGTDVRDIEPGLTGQSGFANVATGRVDGDRIEVEWADLPLGDTLGGGGLSLVYDEALDHLVVIEQRGDWEPFGAHTFTRIEPAASPGPSPSASASK